MPFKWITPERLRQALKRIPELRKIRNFRLASMKQLIDKIKPLNTIVERERKRQEKLKESQGRFF